jgi:hypothetical protein
LTAVVSRPGWQGIASKAGVLVRSPIFAYGAIFLLELHVMWRVWDFKDLTIGDTSGYYVRAASWTHHLQDDIVWSPLYTTYFGTVRWVFGGASATVLAHRVLIVFAAALLALAVLRSLLGPALGLVFALWWAILPANFNVEYEVHLFGLLPVLAAVLLLRTRPTRAARGAAFGVLLGSTLLLRNELVIPTTILLMAVVVYELRRRPSRRELARAYGLPLLLVCLLTVGAYARSVEKGHAAVVEARNKHELNLCQVYAYSYQQRHPTRFTGNPFTDCRPLMQTTFGRPLLSFFAAARVNPSAIGKFVAWNAELFPGGLQVSLFDATSEHHGPGYFPVKEQRTYPIVLSIVVLVLVVAGGAALAADRDYWRREWLLPHAWAAIVLAGVSAMTLVVALTQRPRPEYMYGLTLTLMVVLGLCVAALLRRRAWTDFAGVAAVAAAVALCVGIPHFYHSGPRPIHDGLDRLAVARQRLERPGGVLVASSYNDELCGYLTDGKCTSPSWWELKQHFETGAGLARVLDRIHARVFYADRIIEADPSAAALVAAPGKYGWSRIAFGVGTDGPWSVLARP